MEFFISMKSLHHLVMKECGKMENTLGKENTFGRMDNCLMDHFKMDLPKVIMKLYSIHLAGNSI